MIINKQIRIFKNEFNNLQKSLYLFNSENKFSEGVVNREDSRININTNNSLFVTGKQSPNNMTQSTPKNLDSKLLINLKLLPFIKLSN